MQIPSSPWAVVALIAVAVGCVPTTSRQGVGGYCHRDDQCLEGLRCIDRVCRGADPVMPDAGPRDAGPLDGAAPADAGVGVDSGPPPADAGSDAGPGDAGQDAGRVDAGQPDAGELAMILDAGEALDAGALDAGALDGGRRGG